MTSTNNKFYHLNQYYLRAGDEFKVRQDNAYNIQWDNGSGGNVAVTTSGFYDIVLNTCADAIELNTKTSKDQNISIITSADSYGSDIAMSTSDGITYTLDHTFVSGEEFKFRRDGSWDANWGDNHSADGNADFNSANNISAPGVGAYNIEFSLENLNYVFTSLDETAPVITLVGDAEITVEVGSTYTDLGATASDNYDGDITADIVTVNNVDTSVIGSYTVTYNVSDDAGNAASEVTRTVSVTDTTAPVITLVGDAEITVEVGSTYTDLGATASDNYDGDISADIVTVNNVNTSVIGSYTVTYNVSDDVNATEVTRTVSVTDTTAPVITLVGDTQITVEVGTTYTDLGATASDNYDGDISANISVTNPVDTSVIGSYTL